MWLLAYVLLLRVPTPVDGGANVFHKRFRLGSIRGSFSRNSLSLHSLRNQKEPCILHLLQPYHRITGTLQVIIGVCQIRRPESAWLGNILCRIQTVSIDPNPSPKSKVQNPKSKIQNPKSKIQNPKSKIRNPKSKVQNPNGAVWGRHKKNED